MRAATLLADDTGLTDVRRARDGVQFRRRDEPDNETVSQHVFIDRADAMSRIILFNKPYNVLSQFTDERNAGQPRQTLKHYISEKGVYPAGRLDRDSEGLLVLTDDGALSHRLTHPKRKVTKTYWAQVEGAASEARLEPLRVGIELNDGPCRPARVRLIDEPWQLWPREPPIRERRNIPTSWLSLTIAEGRNRQVRRMCAAIGFPVLRLIRYRVASWTIDGLASGCWRAIA